MVYNFCARIQRLGYLQGHDYPWTTMKSIRVRFSIYISEISVSR